MLSETQPALSGSDTGAKKKFGLVLQGGGALGAFEVGAIEYLYEIGMECAIVSGASSGAMNAVTLAGAKGCPPDVLKALWEELIVDPPVPFLPAIVQQSWAAVFGNPRMFLPRTDYWNVLNWTYLSSPAPLRRTLDALVDWDRVRDPEHMRLIVSASAVKSGACEYFRNLDPAAPFGYEHVLASGSFPVGFSWTMVDEKPYWDGGLTDNTPLKPVIDNLQGDEPQTLPILEIDCNSAAAPLPTNLQQAGFRMFEMLLQNRLKADGETAKSYQRFIRILKLVEQQLAEDAPVRRTPTGQLS
ncbi:MAG: patatin-like phospholipase family protein [Vulcanimicrobiaceae bacterium]